MFVFEFCFVRPANASRVTLQLLQAGVAQYHNKIYTYTENHALPYRRSIIIYLVCFEVKHELVAGGELNTVGVRDDKKNDPKALRLEETRDGMNHRDLHGAPAKP